jgi:hypothetical protein
VTCSEKSCRAQILRLEEYAHEREAKFRKEKKNNHTIHVFRFLGYVGKA